MQCGLTELALPAGHLRQKLLFVAPTVGLYVPAGHCSLLTVPLPQKPPVGQSSQLPEPTAAFSFPGGQASQLALAVLAAYCPGRHGKQIMPVALSYCLPTSQSAQRGAVHVLSFVVERVMRASK